MGQRILIDPITRIEGHLRIEVEVENGRVKDAWSSGQMFRGIEMMLKGRDPRDAHHFVQRSCGVCTYVHALSSARAVEAACNITIPDNARIIRNLLHGAQYQHDHIVHFYHLHALDWVDIVSALSADPVKTASLSENVSGRPGTADYFRTVQDKLKTFVNSGQLGPFNNAYWGHPAYQLPAEANLMAASHYLEALKLQAKAARMHAIFGGKNPHPQSLVVGGVTCIGDLTPERLDEFYGIWKETKEFVDQVYIPDILAVASFYKDWAGIGGNNATYLAYGDFPRKGVDDDLLLPGGVLMGDLTPKPLDTNLITEDVTRGWYEPGESRHPYQGETKPIPAEVTYNTDDKYSWIKAPRYDGRSAEVGPLARNLVAYTRGQKDVKQLVDHVLSTLGVGTEALFSTLGRTAARGIETAVVGNAMETWIDELRTNIARGDKEIYQPWTMPDTGMGYGLNDVPRGALGHWIEIDKGMIKNYQYVVPSTWNLGPRDAQNQKGPVENSLIGTPVADPKQPLEILRTVHSYDPCIACAIHVIDPHTNETYKVRVI
ncbi:nickel-dependent hydrogenase large subunit [Desulfotignum phosphitoxidans]|uniref:Periplasmic [NiFe] hydrogenase large subunit HynA n=1 Tax=Desulfotignum phosphitoxidans DSM 13687 TaxID=1286635 RepID=S0G7S7_9BACT|nr:nickel-dependent hydrogenase large subunit [Desulfotignum phosphitoxidans]EMS81432.1 periplasmic [NiFe] hydrogenase large subunit HynA [Desulfotignum phosphitoxidans DSM 13687]